MGNDESTCSSCLNFWAIVFFSLDISNICSNLTNLTNLRLFADDASLSSVVNDASETFENLANDLRITIECTF